MEIEYRIYKPNSDFREIFSLFKSSFPNSNHYITSYDKYNQYLSWLYLDNPSGKPLGYNAYFNKKCVGHYVGIPMVWSQNNVKLKALLSLNTAVHPEFQGLGIFSNLAKKTYKTAYLEGFDFVYGVSNDNSTVGFKKLGFDIIDKLYIQIAFNFFISKKDIKLKNVLSRRFSDQVLQWRLRRPFTQYFSSSDRYFSKTKNSLLPFISYKMKTKTNTKINKISLFTPSIYMGSQKQKSMIIIPKFFRPVPLNLIFKLINKNATIESSKISDWNFDFLDFDLA